MKKLTNPFTATPPKKIDTAREYKSLNKWNKWLAALHALQGIVILVLSTTRSFPVVQSYLTKDSLASEVSGHPVLAPATHVLFNVNVAYLVASFFFQSALEHLAMATFYRQRYEADLGQGINRLRWFEYALSASVMLVGIGLISGDNIPSIAALISSMAL